MSAILEYVIDWQWTETKNKPLTMGFAENGPGTPVTVVADLANYAYIEVTGLRMREPENRKLAAYPYEEMTPTEKDIAERWLKSRRWGSSMDAVCLALAAFLEGVRAVRGYPDA